MKGVEEKSFAGRSARRPLRLGSSRKGLKLTLSELINKKSKLACAYLPLMRINN